jgi:hypothetical protein
MGALLYKFVFLNIWIILGINVIIILFLIIYKLLGAMRENRYKAFIRDAKEEFSYQMLNFTPEVFARKYRFHRRRNMIYQLMLEIASDKGYDFFPLFDQMGYTDEVINHYRNTQEPQLLKELSIIKSPKAYSLLLQEMQSPHTEIAFRAGYAIACLKLTSSQQKEVISTLISSDIVIQKAIDIINMISPPIAEYIPFLEEQATNRGRMILLHYFYYKISPLQTNYRYLQKKLQTLSGAIIEYVSPLLNFPEQVALAAIKVLGCTGHSHALLLLLNLFQLHPNTSIKAAIALELHHFPSQEVLADLKKMAVDKNYWVRLSAYESLSEMGDEGKQAILELSTISPYPSTNYLVYEILSESDNLQHYIENYKKELEYNAH